LFCVVLIVAVVAVVQTARLRISQIDAEVLRRDNAALSENTRLKDMIISTQRLYQRKTEQLCRVKRRFMDAYRMTLMKMYDDLGLGVNSSHESAAAVLLHEIGRVEDGTCRDDIHEEPVQTAKEGSTSP